MELFSLGLESFWCATSSIPSYLWVSQKWSRFGGITAKAGILGVTGLQGSARTSSGDREYWNWLPQVSVYIAWGGHRQWFLPAILFLEKCPADPCPLAYVLWLANGSPLWIFEALFKWLVQAVSQGTLFHMLPPWEQRLSFLLLSLAFLNLSPADFLSQILWGLILPVWIPGLVVLDMGLILSLLNACDASPIWGQSYKVFGSCLHLCSSYPFQFGLR